ncbi:ANTAR domain-containing protein [Streptomyces sp. KAU_LT]|uniref:ANTAR domain-containing protein n=1 Tax=Streptomyces sp. KAU_LT TaxID=3046669 RepID=UPI0024B7AD74|nr:ANTAR domain-containing protein [Streptomyces sp. KAU_LT]MDI9835706.1 ANTAR domain-containing protein [Streptomyces sp. KAU_LT]
MSEQVESDETIAALRQEVAQLQHAVFSHAIVDQAIGVVVAYGGVRPGTAWEVLKEISQHTNTKLREVAELVVRWPHEGRLPEDVRGALTAAVARANPRDRAEQPTGS